MNRALDGTANVHLSSTFSMCEVCLLYTSIVILTGFFALFKSLIMSWFVYSFPLQRLLVQRSRTGFCLLLQCCPYEILFCTFNNYISSCSYFQDSQIKDPVKHQGRQNVPLHYSVISVKELTPFPLYYTVVLPLLMVSSNGVTNVFRVPSPGKVSNI